ncbi:MAG: hypothetical protein VR64_24200 [Desulfatitalea sp. BRH_c12]|nr:MAG: hypothetical protein VR64_24200 [Desulfatitalea sp. BRH_c12]
MLENMIAILFFTVGILAAASMSGTSMKAITQAQQGMYNSVSAAGVIEALLAMPYDDALLLDADDGYDPSSPDHGPFDIEESRSRIAWEVQEGFPAPGTKRISVTVQRRDRGGRTVSFTYDYIKARDYRLHGH